MSRQSIQMKEFDDLSSRQELLLGELVKQKFHTDFFILDKYPLKIRYSFPIPPSPPPPDLSLSVP
jgi:aspartyl/asparaginyl-tRNA synthetase